MQIYSPSYMRSQDKRVKNSRPIWLQCELKGNFIRLSQNKNRAWRDGSVGNTPSAQAWGTKGLSSMCSADTEKNKQTCHSFKNLQSQFWGGTEDPLHLSPQCWVCKHIQAHLTFSCRLWGRTQATQAFGLALQTESLPQALSMVLNLHGIAVPSFPKM